MSKQKVYVRLDFEIAVELPVEIPDSEIGEDGVLADGKFRTAAINAATGWITQSGEIDTSGDLGIPFQTLDRGETKSSMAAIFAEVNDTDAVEVRVE